MVGSDYEFRPVRHEDLDLVRGWLHQPHVRRWWGDPDTELGLIAGDIGTSTCGYIVHLQGRPFAYVQTWVVAETAEYPDQPLGTLGVDPFIGVPAMCGIGHGSRFLAQLAHRLIEEGATRLIIDPDPANVQAVRAYQRAGFRPVETQPRSDTLLMCWRGSGER